MKSDVDLDDNFAFAEGDAEAFGKSTIAEAFTFTKTVQNKFSGASSTSISGSDE
ncbi:MAG: hypothetical protein HC917_24785 [Richelia sp. SM2_1_7]|nr:hypothetical protein [Richelia sp. SM2_1_7]